MGVKARDAQELDSFKVAGRHDPPGKGGMPGNASLTVKISRGYGRSSGRLVRRGGRRGSSAAPSSRAGRVPPGDPERVRESARKISVSHGVGPAFPPGSCLAPFHPAALARGPRYRERIFLATPGETLSMAAGDSCCCSAASCARWTVEVSDRRSQALTEEG
jgi:hypothetical protein